MTKYKICVYAICKNEEANVKEWIESVKGADLISVMDTGSADNTVKLFKDFQFSEENDYGDGVHIKLFIHEFNSALFHQTKYFHFGAARYQALLSASCDTADWDKYDDDDNEWIMVSFDLDERPTENFFDNLRALFENEDIPDDDNYIIQCRGITKTDSGESSQLVANKIHTDRLELNTIKWDRQVHERLIIEELHTCKRRTRLPKVLTFDNYDLSYYHNQDKDKKRDYYEALKESYEEFNDTSALTCIYLAWEAGLHGEEKACIKYSYECIKASLDENDLDYGDWQNISQAFCNIITSIKADTLDNAQRLSSVLKSCDKIINDKVPNYVPNRRMYMVMGTSYEALFAYLCKLIADTENPIEENEIDEITSLAESYCKAAIYYYKRVLQVEDRPFSWFDDNELYQKDNEIISKFPLFYEALGDDQRAVAYSVLLANNTLDEELKESYSKFEDVYLDKFNNWVKDVEPWDDLVDNIRDKYLSTNPEEVDNVNSGKTYQPFAMEETTPASITPDVENFFDLNDPSNISDEIIQILNDDKKEDDSLFDIIDGNYTSVKDDKEESVINQSNNKVCVYAICKNELKYVDNWIKSMEEADLIVVLDTGSTDGTYEKLRELAAKHQTKCKLIVKQEVVNPWRFDHARNLSLKLVPNEYNILISTDLDEILEPGWAQILRDEWIEGKHERGIYKYTWSHLENGEGGRVFHYDKIHSRKWIWKYPCHELLWNTETKTNLYNNENTLYLFNKIHLHHYPDWSKPRNNYMPLLELRAKENPDDYYGLIYLAHEYSYKDLYEKSNKLFKYILNKFSDRYNDIEKASCYLFMGDNYTSMKQYEDALKMYNKAIEIDNTYREPYLNMAKVYMEKKQYETAIQYINKGIENGKRHYSWLERDHSWSWEPFDLLSLCYFYKTKPNIVASYIFASRAAQYDTSNERLQKNVNLILKHLSDQEFLKELDAK